MAELTQNTGSPINDRISDKVKMLEDIKSNQKTITEETAKKLIGMIDNAPGIAHIRKSQILTGVAATSGLVLFTAGIQKFIEKTLNINSPLTEIGIGLLFLIISGLLFKKLL